jgi:hypothetical protein
MKRILDSRSLWGVVLVSALFSMGATSSPKGSDPGAARANKTAGYGNADSISEEEMKIYDYFLASDQLEGRNLPSRGYDTAALYVASHLAEWGLKPGGSTTNTNGPLQPYLMPFELVSRQIVLAETKASLTAPALAGRGGPAPSGAPRTTDLEYGKDWTMAGGGFRGPVLGESFDVTGNLVFAGNGYVINKSNINPYEGLDVRGKIIVVAGLPPEIAAQRAALAARGGRGADTQSPLGENCTDYLTPEEYAAKNGALAVVTIADFQQLTGMANPNPAFAAAASLNGPNFQVVKFQDPPACPAAPSIVAGLKATDIIFQGEKMNAARVFYGAGTNAKLDSLELSAEKKLSLHVVIHGEQGHGENVVGMLEGSDPELKNEYVVISAHLDHIGLSMPLPDGHNVNNGADDDGSGSTGLLAIARSYAQGAAKGIRPKRSIIFLWNGGEEKGLWGSRYFAEFPPVDLTKVVANLNMDMIGRTKGAGYSDPDPTHMLVSPGEALVVGPQISSDDLETTIETVNNSYQKLVLNHFYDTTAPDATHDNLGPKPNGQRIFYRSDHYNFAKMGIPIAFFTVGLHPDYHRPTDTPEKIDYKEIQVVSKTVAAVAWVLGNQAGRPKLKANLPDQLVKDMKSAQVQGWGKITPVLPPLPGEPY